MIFFSWYMCKIMFYFPKWSRKGVRTSAPTEKWAVSRNLTRNRLGFEVHGIVLKAGTRKIETFFLSLPSSGHSIQVLI